MTMRISRAILPLVLALTALSGFAGHAVSAGSAYPIKPVKIVVPFTPGGTTDILAREIGQKLQQAYGQTFIIDNRPGAGGSIGAELAARAEPDGYTILMGHIGTLAVNPTLYPKLAYDPVRDFAPVAWVARVPNVLVVNASTAVRSVADLVALAKARPDSLAYGSGGNGSAAHLASEYFKFITGAPILHVPYKGTSPFVTDLIAGEIQIGFTGAPVVMPMVKAGKLKALAVSSPARMAAFPEIPTMSESGFPGFEADQWYGVVAPRGTPEAVVLSLNAEINKAMGSAEVRARLEQEGAEAVTTTPGEYGLLIKREIERWRPVLKAANVKIE